MNNKKNITKKILIKILIISLFPIFLYSQTANDNFKELYSKIKEKYSSIYPKSFEAYIEGKIVERQISTIPERNYTSTKDKIKLKFVFTQGAKPTMTLENVDSFYRNMFAIFDGVLETTGFYAVVGNAQNFNSFSDKFTFERQLVHSKTKSLTSDFFGNTADFKHNSARLNNCNPVFR